MRRRSAQPAWLAAALLPAGALAVHQLRYLVGSSEYGEAALRGPAHEYLSVLTVAVALILGLGFSVFLRRLAQARRGELENPRRRPFVQVQLAAAAALVAIHTAQEAVEAWVADGHAPGLDGLVGNGGWAVIVFALLLGAALALALRGAEVALAAAIAAVRRAPGRRAERPRAVARATWCKPSGVLARHLAGRAPPAASFA